MKLHKQGGPPVKEEFLLSRRFSCQGGWDREKEEERRIEGERDRSAVGVMWKDINKEVLLSRRSSCCQGGSPVKEDLL